METMTISQVSKSFCISTRMLRYYEQTGLIDSFRRDDYAYRLYDETALLRLQQILILRKLRIPVKQIKRILQNSDAVTAVEIFRQNIEELNGEIDSLSIIRDILSRFVGELQSAADVQIHRLIEQDDTLMAAIESLSSVSINFKEDKAMDNLKKADETLSRLTDVCIVYLPPATVAAAHFIGDDPETRTYEMIDQFVQEAAYVRKKPDLRHYGFNHPNPIDESGLHGYEIWVTIPEEFEVPAPLAKKRFPGGLFAAHMISMGNFNEWEWLFDWVNKSEKYEFAGDMKDQEHMCGLLDEHLNYVSHVKSGNTEPEEMQLDLLMPIREVPA